MQKFLCSVYNNEMWQCRWDINTAIDYLKDYFEAKKFVGFILENEEQIEAAIFCHEKVWWNNSEIFVDEMFVKPELQRNGHETELLHTVEEYIKEHNLAGFTLLTNKYAPAPKFYTKNGFGVSEHILYMYKEV